MTPIRINLLPHRQAKRERESRLFTFMAVGTVALGAAAVLVGHMGITSATENQMRRNDFLRQEITKLDQEIKEINQLKEHIRALVARKEVVENLQSRRTVPVHVMDELARRLPDGLRLRSVKQTAENTLAIQGSAHASPLVSDYMRSLEDSAWFENLALVEVKATSQGAVRTNEFSLTLTISDPNATAKTDQKPAKGAT